MRATSRWTSSGSTCIARYFEKNLAAMLTINAKRETSVEVRQVKSRLIHFAANVLSARRPYRGTTRRSIT